MLHCNIAIATYLAIGQSQFEVFDVSKQLTISATASVFAMALFAFSTSVSTSGGNAISSAPHNTGATTEAAAPALGQLIPAIGLIR